LIAAPIIINGTKARAIKATFHEKIKLIIIPPSKEHAASLITAAPSEPRPLST
jgi:hypothetical protein